LPVEEVEEAEGDDDMLTDELDAIWLIPGTLPEPCWEFSMCFNHSTSSIKQLLSKAVRMPLEKEETKTFIRALKIDPELVFHISMTPQKLPNLVIHNASVALELLLCLTHTVQITKYYDALCSMKLCLNTLELFNHLLGQVELP
jgi:hypothetical protein